MNEAIETLKKILAALLSLPGLIASAIAPFFKKPELFTSSSGKQPEKQRFVKRGPGKLFDAWCYNDTDEELFFGCVDRNSPAADGDHLLSPQRVLPRSSSYLTFPSQGRPFEQGIVIVASTTLGIVTLPAAASQPCYFDAVAE